MGFRGLLLGLEEKSDFYDSQPVDLGKPFGVVTRRQVTDCYTQDLDDAVRLWKDWQRFGLPHGGGYADETEEWLTVVSAFEDDREAVVAMINKRKGGKVG